MTPKPRKEIDTSTYTGRFALRLRSLREKKGLSVDEFSAKTGIPRQTLYNWESNISQPPIGQLPVLAEGLGVKIAKLLPE